MSSFCIWTPLPRTAWRNRPVLLFFSPLILPTDASPSSIPAIKTKSLSLVRYYYCIPQITCDLFFFSVYFFICLYLIVPWLPFMPRTMVPVAPGSTRCWHAALRGLKKLFVTIPFVCVWICGDRQSLLNLKAYTVYLYIYIYFKAKGNALAQGELGHFKNVLFWQKIGSCLQKCSSCSW